MSEAIYTQDGVNVELGDNASSIAAKFCRQTYDNSKFAEVIDFSKGSYRGPRGIRPKILDPKISFSSAPDGIGTKVVIHQAADSYNLAAFDLVAMTSFDLVRWGGLPIWLTSVLDVASLGDNNNSEAFKKAIALYSGAKDAADKTGMILLNGETATLGYQVGSECENAKLKFNWGGAANGAYHDDRMILGDTLEPGQVIMLMEENGFRSNGISSVRAALRKQFGEKWYDSQEAEPYIKAASIPSVLYDQFFCKLNGWYGDEDNIKVHSLIHLTGGSFESKFGRDILFKQGLSADIDDLYTPTDIMQQCGEWRGFDDKGFYKTFNGRQGALAVIDADDVERFIQIATNFGLNTKPGGIIVKKDIPEIRMKSKFTGKDISYT